MSESDHPGVLTHPPLLYLAFLLAGYGLHRAWPATLGLGSAGGALGVALAAAGIALGLWCATLFRRAGTNLRTDRPSTAVVVRGPYRLSRNPIYLGLTLAYLGIALWLDSAWVLGLAAPALALMDRGVIAREERYLEGKFGDEYRAYRARVRRWL